MKAIHYSWVKHLDPSDRDNFEQAVRADSLVLSRLNAILSEMEADIDREEASVTQFADPNWHYKQAFRIGDRARIGKLKELLSHLYE